MDDVGSYGVEAERVISDLKNAVGVADDRLINLQRELDYLAEKAKKESYVWNRELKNDSSSEMDDEDISRYLHECSDVASEKASHSLSECTSLSAHGEASTKPYLTTQEKNGVTPRITTRSSLVADTKKNMHSIKNFTETQSLKSPEDSQKSVRSSTMEDEYKHMSREELYKKLLELSAYKHSTPEEMEQKQQQKYQHITPQEREQKKQGRSPSAQDTPRNRQKISSNKSSRHGAIPDIAKFLFPGIDVEENDVHFKPIHPEVVTSRSDGIAPIISKEMQSWEVKELEEQLEAEKKRNEKLREDIAVLEDDYKELETKYDLKNHEKNTGKVVVMVEKIQHAQKIRETAMVERLRVAAYDRDEALMRAKAMHAKNVHLQRNASICRNGDRTLMEIVDRISTADSARVIDKYGNELLERMHNLRNARKRITSEEMSAVIKERDDAIAKCHLLQQELQNCMEELNVLKKSKDTSVSTSLKAKVISTQEESTKTHEKLHSAEEEIQMLRIYYSLHKSLTLAQDKDLAEKYNQYMTNIREEAMKRVQIAKQVEAENQQLRDKLYLMEKQTSAIESKNQGMQGELQHMREKCSKLERLVKVLRRKLMGQAQAESV